jgi:hypothetical protein
MHKVMTHNVLDGSFGITHRQNFRRERCQIVANAMLTTVRFIWVQTVANWDILCQLKFRSFFMINVQDSLDAYKKALQEICSEVAGDSLKQNMKPKVKSATDTFLLTNVTIH